jgi:hypothetical protein
MVTAPAARGRSCVSAILRAIESILARAGIAGCGLFADAGDPTLAVFVLRGFVLRGGFPFHPALARARRARLESV